MNNRMEKIVALCKRRGFIFQSSEIYGGIQGFWDYGPLGTELKRNVREAWYRDMVATHDELAVPPGAPSAFSMVGMETSIIMHPQVWKVSGHYDLFHDVKVDCRETGRRYRLDHLRGRWLYFVAALHPRHVTLPPERREELERHQHLFICLDPEKPEEDIHATVHRAAKLFGVRSKDAEALFGREDAWSSEPLEPLTRDMDLSRVVAPDAALPGTLTEPREFNLMLQTILGALGGEESKAFLRPETAQGMFVNFKNVLDSTRVKPPFGIAQVGKSFRNEITPRNFTFRSREFEQMEMEFFCRPDQSKEWYQYWRDRRFQWYLNLGITSDNLQLRDHAQEELAHYSVGTADIEYAFPFLEPGEYGELEGVAHRGDFDLRSHAEGKLVAGPEGCFVVETDANGQPKYKGSGKDLQYFDDQTRERFYPHVIEPAAGADRATLAFLCEAYHEDEAPDEKGAMQTRTVLKLHPRLAPIKAAVLPLIKKEGMPEKAAEIYRDLKRAGLAAYYDQQGAIGRRYRRQDEAGTPFCITIDGQTATDHTVTLRDRDTLEQIRVPVQEIVETVRQRVE
ncbi:MAG: glycine--tRNA ligase [Planctomycetales bacterium]